MSRLTVHETKAMRPTKNEVFEQRPISRIFDEVMDPFTLSGLDEDVLGMKFYPRGLSGSYPTVELKEEKDHYLMTAELPGMTKEDISVEVKDGVLTLSGEKKHEKKEKREGYFYSERSYGSFCRSFRLGENISEKDMNATFKDGVLHVTLKKEKGKEPKRIAVK